MSKVYCDDCRFELTPHYLEYPAPGKEPPYRCFIDYTLQDTPIFQRKIHAFCRDKNRANDCKDFKPKVIGFWEKIFKIKWMGCPFYLDD